MVLRFCLIFPVLLGLVALGMLISGILHELSSHEGSNRFFHRVDVPGETRSTDTDSEATQTMDAVRASILNDQLNEAIEFIDHMISRTEYHYEMDKARFDRFERMLVTLEYVQALKARANTASNQQSQIPAAGLPPSPATTRLDTHDRCDGPYRQPTEVTITSVRKKLERLREAYNSLPEIERRRYWLRR